MIQIHWKWQNKKKITITKSLQNRCHSVAFHIQLAKQSFPQSFVCAARSIWNLIKFGAILHRASVTSAIAQLCDGCDNPTTSPATFWNLKLFKGTSAQCWFVQNYLWHDRLVCQFLCLCMENHLWKFQPNPTHIIRDMNENINKENKRKRSVTCNAPHYNHRYLNKLMIFAETFAILRF